MATANVETRDFEPEAACRQVQDFHKAVLRLFFFPCFLPTCLLIFVVAASMPLVGSGSVMLFLLPVVAVYLGWTVLVFRRLREARMKAGDNLRRLKLDYPDLVRRSRRVMLVVGSVSCTALGVLGVLTTALVATMVILEPPGESDHLVYLLIPAMLLFGIGMFLQAVAFWKAKTWLFPAVCFATWGLLPNAIFLWLLAAWN